MTTPTPHNTPHLFLLQPGNWEGEGTITLSVSPTTLHFKTEWNIQPIHEGSIEAVHSVHIEGSEAPLKNILRFFNFTKESFQVELRNEILGSAYGKGVIDGRTLGWEFRHHDAMDGYELFKIDEKGGYHVHAEYASPDKCHSTIHAHIHLI